MNVWSITTGELQTGRCIVYGVKPVTSVRIRDLSFALLGL